jgi:microcystin-dependent protein
MPSNTTYGLHVYPGTDVAATMMEDPNNAMLLDPAAGHVGHVYPRSAAEWAVFLANAVSPTAAQAYHASTGPSSALYLGASGLLQLLTMISGANNAQFTWPAPVMTVSPTSGTTAQLTIDTISANVVNGNTFNGLPVTVPVGSIVTYAANGVPAGFLYCNGTPVSRAVYAALFSVIGTSYGAGDGSSTFNLPDLRDRVLLGAGANFSFGQSGGEINHTLNVSELASHGHGVNDGGHDHGINDPGHNHGISDPGHNHNTNDPGHAHNFTATVIASNSSGPGGSGNIGAPPSGGTTQSATTGIGITNSFVNVSVQANGTGIGVQAHTANLSIQNNGSSAGHNNLQPYLALIHLIKT